MSDLSKTYWEQKYQDGKLGWDIGYPSTPLKEYVEQLTDQNISILIPGCGNGYEIEYLLSRGFMNITVVDIAEAPLVDLQNRTGLPSERLVCDDFFNISGEYDLVLEQTFFCALLPKLRADYVQKMHDLLNHNGKIAGVLFDFDLSEAGPPFGGSKESYVELFDRHFEIEIMERSYNSIGPRQGSELFIKLIKK